MEIIIAESNEYATPKSNNASAHNGRMKYPEFAQRFNQALAEKKNAPTTQVELGKWFGFSQPTINCWIKGEKLPGMASALKISAKLGVSAEWLLSGQGSKYPITNPKDVYRINVIQQGINNIITHHEDDDVPDGFISVDEYDVSFSAGNGRTAHYELLEDSKPVVYRVEWFQEERLNPAHVKRFKVSGDSMEPYAYAGNHILVNLEENDITKIIDDEVYAIRYNDELRVKVLFRHIDGSLTLRSFNPAYKDEVVPAHLVEQHISIIGRVRDRGGTRKRK